MFITRDKIANILNDYLHQVLIPKSPSGFQTFASGVAIGLANRKINTMLADPQTVNMLTAVNVVDESGRINVNELKSVITDAINMSGAINVPVINYNIDSTDIQQIFDIAARYAVNGEQNANDANVSRAAF